MAKARTLYDKIWDDHLVDEQEDGTCLLYIDRHLVHEVTSPQAFEGLRLTGRKVRRAKLYYLRNLRGKAARIVEKQDYREDGAKPAKAKKAAKAS